MWLYKCGPQFEEFPRRVRRRVEKMLKSSRLDRKHGIKRERNAGKQNTPWYVKDPKERSKMEQYLRIRKHVENIYRSKCPEEVRRAQHMIRKCGLENHRIIRNLVVKKCRELGCIEQSQPMLESWLKQNTFSWSVMLAANAQSGHLREALYCFRRMTMEGVTPSVFSLCTVLDICSLEESYIIHEFVVYSSFPVEHTFWDRLITTYGRNGKLDYARRVFEECVPVRSVESWTSIISAFSQHGHVKEAVEFFRHMDLEGTKPKREALIQLLHSFHKIEHIREGRLVHEVVIELGSKMDVRVCTELLKMYSRCGSLRDARIVFDESSRKDSGLWTAMIAENVRHGAAEVGLNLYRRMSHPVNISTEHGQAQSRDSSTFAAALDACTDLKDLRQGKRIHEDILSMDMKLTTELETALIRMYGTCGDLSKAVEVYQHVEASESAQNAMIQAYARTGHNKNAHIKQVLEIVRGMDLMGMNPDETTMLNILISLRNSGLVGKFIQYFRSISADRGLQHTPEHYVCVVGMLVREKKVKDAYDLVENMPFVPSPSLLGILGVA